MGLTEASAFKDGSIVNNDIKSDAAIAKTKLASLDIINADINASAAIAKTKLASLNIVNADINASAAISGTKISPDFSGQNIINTGTLSTGDATATKLTISGSTVPQIIFNDSNDNPDFSIRADVGQFLIKDTTNNVERLVINSDGHVDVTGNLDVNGQFKLLDDDNSHSIGFKAPATIASNLLFTLPDTDAAFSGYALISDGAGTLSWGVAGGASGAANNQVFWENDQTITASYAITNGKNAGSFGPITIASGVVVTVGSGKTWSVV